VAAVPKGRIAQAPGALGKSVAQMRAYGRARAFARCLVIKRFRFGHGGGGLKIGSQNRTPSLPESGQNGPRQANVPARQATDLRVCVELRGFEPLTFSMRTERSSLQNHCLMMLPHVRAFG
jgi:hypothetical protein